MAIIKRDYQPAYINDFSSSLLDGFYLQEGETLNDAIARAAEAFSFGDEGLAQRIYEAVHDGWFMFSSPILANAPSGSWTREPSREDWENHTTLQHFDGEKARALPISCYSLAIGDTIDAQLEAMVELAALSVSGGGVGLHNRIRATSPKAPGPIPFEKVLDAEIGYYKQSSTRRGATAYYMDVDHPDIIEHIKFRLPTGGDRKRRSDNITQFHSAVNVTDEFIEAVIGDKDFDLRCPHTGQVHETVKARKIWETLLETRALTGEPYIFKIDTANRALPQTQKDLGLTVKGSNLCQSGDTLILTDGGLKRLADLSGCSFNVQNGDGTFSPATAFVTGEDVDVYELRLENGQRIKVTEDHIFEVRRIFGEGNRNHEYVEMRAADMVGERVSPFLGNGDGWSGELHLEPEKLTLFGLIQGDGCFIRDEPGGTVKSVAFNNSEPEVVEFIRTSCAKLGYSVNVPESGGVFNLRDALLISDLVDFGMVFDIIPNRNMPSGVWSLPSDGVEFFLRGLFSANGCAMPRYNRIAWLGTCEKLAEELQDILIALGYPAYRTKDGGRVVEWDNGTYTGHPNFTISTGSAWAYDMFQEKIGFLHVHKTTTSSKTSRTARTWRSSKVLSVTYVGKERVYDFNEPETHWGWANGFKVHNCNEITLTTDEDRTFVCCLSSLNLLKFDEWKDSTVVADLTRFLDNVIQYFIEMAGEVKGMSKAVYSAMRERALGIGAMGWHHYLQSKGIPFESGGVNSAISHTHVIFKNIKGNATLESQRLAYERGEAPDMEGTGRRNSHLLAVAPNSNSGIILGVSPSIEPEAGVAYVHKTRAGSHIVKNPHFEKILNAYSDDAAWRDKQWQQILAENGSIQNLDWCTEEQKNLFRTAYEIDQHWIVEQADARQQHLCQSQSLNLFFPFGVSKEYYNSVHLKAIKAEYVKGLYYSRMRRSQDMSAIHRLEKRTLKDWSGDTDESACIACEG